MDKKKRLGILAIAVGAMLLFTAVAADGSALACKGGYKGKCVRAVPGGGTATLTVSPNMVPLDSTSITISGSGFAPGRLLIIDTGFLPQTWVSTGYTGSINPGGFSFVYSPPSSAGFNIPGPAFVQALDPGTLAMLATGNYTVCSDSTCTP